MEVLLKCPHPQCGSTIPVSCLVHEQEVACSRCGNSFVFLNAGRVSCESCSEEVSYSLKTSRPIAYCDRCRRDLSHLLERAHEPLREENDNSYQYCGLNQF